MLIWVKEWYCYLHAKEVFVKDIFEGCAHVKMIIKQCKVTICGDIRIIDKVCIR